MGDQARRRAIEDFSPEKSVQKYLELYCKTIGG
jgi:hypothetical protein